MADDSKPEVRPFFSRLMEADAPAAAPAGSAPSAASPPAEQPALRPLFGKLAQQQEAVIPTQTASILSPVSLFTGAGRTEFEDVPEFTPTDMRRARGENWIQAVVGDPAFRQVIGGGLFSSSPEAQRDIYRAALKLAPEDTFQDRYGNWMMNFNGQRYYINKPGLSGQDITEGTRDLFLGIGAGKLTGRIMPSSNGAGALALRGLGSAALNSASSVGTDVAAGALGSEQGIDTGRAVTAGVLSGAAEVAAPIVANGVARMAQRFGGPRQLPPAPAAGFDTRLNANHVLDSSGAQTMNGPDLFKAAGLNIEHYTPEQVQQIVELARKSGPNPGPQALAEAAARMRSAEFGIDRTRGQMTRDRGQLNQEASLRNDNDMRLTGFDRTQGEQAATALERTRARTGSSVFSADPPNNNDTGSMIAGHLRAAEQASDEGVERLYDRLKGMNLQGFTFARELTPDFVARMGKALDNQFDLPGTATREARRFIDRITKDGAPVTLADAEQLRRRMGRSIRDGAADSSTLVDMRTALDDWIDSAVGARAFSGDARTLDTLLEARAAARQHAADFDPKAIPQRVTTVLNRTLGQGVDGHEVIDSIFDKASRDLSGANILPTIQHIERVTQNRPGSSIVRDSLRQAALQRVFGDMDTSTAKGMLAAARRIETVIDGDGAKVFAHLFNNPEERQTLQRLAAELRDISTLSTSERGKAADNARAGFARTSLGALALGGAGNFLGMDPLTTGAVGGALGLGARAARQMMTSRAAVNPPGPRVDWRSLIPEQQMLPQAAQNIIRGSALPAAGLLAPEPEPRTGLFQ